MDGTVLICLKGWEDVRSSFRFLSPARFGFMLLHVTDIRPLGAREIALAGLSGRHIPPDGRRLMNEAAEATTRELLAEAGEKVVAADGQVLSLEHRVGDPGPEIVRLAGESGVDLIVLWAGETDGYPPAGPPGRPPHHPPPRPDQHPGPPPPKPHRHLSPVVHFVLTHAGCPVLVLP